MIGKTVIGGRKSGIPEITFEWALRQNGINPTTDLEIDTSIVFGAISGAFIGGTGNFVNLFEPRVLQVLGYVVSSLGELGGVVPYAACKKRLY